MSARKGRTQNVDESPRESAHNPIWRAADEECLKVIQCDQTRVFATSIMLCNEEVRHPLRRPVQLPPTSEVQHVNPIDRSFGGNRAGWRGLGILSLARLV
jgi:hypothetical protein